MKRTLSFVKRRKYFFIGALIILIIVLFLGKKKGVETYAVTRGDVVESIILSGEARTSDRADLGFASSGRINRILVKNNQAISAGEMLAQLEIGELLADLRIKEINAKTSTLDLEEAKQEVDRITKQENTKVESAYRKLLSDDLALVADSSSYTVEAPDISGAYDGVAEGQYKMRIVDEDFNSNDFVLRTFGLESTEVIIKEEGYTPLGTKGLFVSFKDDLELYEDTAWFLSIPNKNGSSYVANLNAYNEAKQTRDLNIQNAKAAYEKLLTEEGSIDSVALAEISKIRAEIRKNTVYAPFRGTVTSIDKQVGENISSGERLLTVIGDGRLEIVLQAPELDVPKISVGTAVRIYFDALPGETFWGELQSLNSRETEVDGVPIYEAFVSLPSDPRIKTGMSAKGEIVLAERKEALSVPDYLVSKEGDVSFVHVLRDDGEVEKRTVVTGILGSDSMREIISGIDEEEKVIIRE